jgi:hypothetical protein
MSHLPRRIVAAANIMIDGPHKDLVVVGVRHFDELMVAQYKALGYGPDNRPNCHQGFVDNDYKWLNRNEAWLVAQEASQIHFAAGTTKGCLHSEDLY